jgi:2-dehydro-3-deoxyphosphooctonate aldolase (KDO 8-P synthase)
VSAAAAPQPAPTPVTPCRVGPHVVGDGRPLLLIAGPCVIESRDHALRHAERIRDVAARVGMPYCFKSSYDKANRSSGRSFRGPGLETGLRVLAEVRTLAGVPVLTDFHLPQDASAVAEAVDVLQVPAFLCRQTDMLLAAAGTGKAVAVKKGQFLSPWDMKNVVDKLREAGCEDVLLTERGASFGYGALVVDFRSLPVMRSFGAPVCFDATHSVQRPGGLGDRSGGDRREVPALARAAAAVGMDALFLEVHEDPDHAPSDGPNMVVLGQLEGLLRTVLAVREAAAR